MQSLEYLSAERLLAQIPFNENTNKAIDEFILNYFAWNKKILNKILDQGIYHAFYRFKDPNIYDESDEQQVTEIELLKTFMDETSAVNWIKENGQFVTEEQYANVRYPCVITLIYYDNDGVYYPGDEPQHLHGISARKHPTYAFDQEAYDMLIKEHIYNFHHGETKELIPYWIYYIQDNKILQGMTAKDLKKLHKKYTYYQNDKEKKLQDFNTLSLFHKNPAKYVYKKLNQ